MLNAERAVYDKRVQSVLSSPDKKQKIVRYFPETHLGNSHRGLGAIAKKHDIDVTKLGAGEYVIFVNGAQTALKMFAPGNVVAHLKMPGNARLDPRIISLVPKFFNGSKINYDEAIEQVIRKEFDLL